MQLNDLKVRAKVMIPRLWYDIDTVKECEPEIIWKMGYIAPVSVLHDFKNNLISSTKQLISEEVDNISFMNTHNLCGTPKCYTFLEDTVCRYTGVRDSNDKEVFENDIVEIEGIIPDDENVKGIGKIIFDKGAFYVYRFDVQGCTPLIMLDDFTILGNIFDNPELMKIIKEDEE